MFLLRTVYNIVFENLTRNLDSPKSAICSVTSLLSRVLWSKDSPFRLVLQDTRMLAGFTSLWWENSVRVFFIFLIIYYLKTFRISYLWTIPIPCTKQSPVTICEGKK